MSRFAAVAFVLALTALCALAKDEPPKPAIKSAEARRAIVAYEKAVAQAQLEFDNRVDAERRKLQQALAAAQTAATKAGDLEDAIRIRDYRGDADTKGQLIANLNAKTWIWHWEKEGRGKPFKFNLDATGKSKDDAHWRMEQRWVLTNETHYLIPLDDNTLRGFFIETGREVGAYAEKK